MALEGTLQDMSLGDLFQVFRLGPKSGVLLVTRDQERSVIYVDRGRLIDAFVVRGAERTVVSKGDEAVLYTLSWDDAAFVFRHDLSVAGRPIQIEHDSEWLVMEGMRRRTNPLRALPYHTLTLDTQLRLSPLPTNAESSVSLDVDQWRILSHAANTQDLRTICKATGLQPERALHIVAELLSIGLVEVVPLKPARPAQRPQQSAPARQEPSPALAMSTSSAARKNNGVREQPMGGRSLLNAIMRRISEL